MKKKIAILLCIYIVWGVLSRTVFHLGPNVEFVTAIAISSGLLMKNKMLAFAVPVVVMFISDLFIGNSNIFIFTWSGFIFPVVLGFMISKILKKTAEKKYLKLTSLSCLSGISSGLIFFLWTNFGHWLTTNMYTKDLTGLIDCYINAIPFLKPQLAGNLIIVPLFVMATFFVFNYSFKSNQRLIHT
jgi:hypothetical protein